MGNFGKWLTGILILALVAAIVHFFTPWGAKANSVKMGESVESALTSYKDISVDMQGNVAKLSGETPSEKIKAEVIAAAENAQCEKCSDRKAGERWHEVDGTDINVKPPVVIVRPYTLQGTRTDDGGVVLNGYARNDIERDDILAAAEAAFPGKVTDNEIKIADGAPYSGWKDVATTNLRNLAMLENGQFLMEEADSVLTGRAATEDVRSSIITSYAGLPNGYESATNIAVPNAVAVNTGQVKSEAICQQLFDNLKGDNQIQFSYNGAEIRDSGSVALLGNLASAAKQCASFRIEVQGHTDSDGPAAYNLDLSRRRAEAVVEFLVQNGVNPDNITGGGYGESQPIASNDTPEGMAKNRRIEFIVTQSK